jgi:hypothetical protein
VTAAKHLFAAISLVLAAGSAGAAPVPVLRVAELERASTVVIIGYIDRVEDVGAGVVHTENGDLPGRTQIVNVVVEQVVKGGSVSSVAVRFVLPDAQIGYDRPAASGDYRMFFVRGDAEPYSFTSPFYTSVAAAPGLRLTATNPADRMFQAFGQIATDTQLPLAAREQALYNISDSDNSVARTSLRRAFADTDSNIRIGAARALLASGDASALAFAVEALSGRTSVASDEALAGLAMAVGRSVKDPVAIPALVRLLTQGNVEGRRAAATALRQIRPTNATRGLLAAMSDTDRQVRYTAVAALAEISGELNWLPSMDYFWSNEAPFIEHWRTWAQSHPPSNYSSRSASIGSSRDARSAGT